MSTGDEGWFKAQASTGGACCVLVRFEAAVVRVRDSKHQGPAVSQPEIRVPIDEWNDLLAALGGGADHFTGSSLSVQVDPSGWSTFRSGPTSLSFTSDEMAAFVDGISNEEFTLSDARATEIRRPQPV